MDLQKPEPRIDTAFRQVITDEDRNAAVNCLDLFSLTADRLNRLEQIHAHKETYVSQVIISAIDYVRRADMTVN